jgi:hypothetical protein
MSNTANMSPPGMDADCTQCTVCSKTEKQGLLRGKLPVEVTKIIDKFGDFVTNVNFFRS